MDRLKSASIAGATTFTESVGFPEAGKVPSSDFSANEVKRRNGYCVSTVPKYSSSAWVKKLQPGDVHQSVVLRARQKKLLGCDSMETERPISITLAIYVMRGGVKGAVSKAYVSRGKLINEDRGMQVRHTAARAQSSMLWP